MLLLITFADLYLNFSNAVTIGKKTNPSTYEIAPLSTDAVKKYEGIDTDNTPATKLNDSELSKGLFRVYTKPEGPKGTAPFGYNRGMIFKTFLVEGFEPLDLDRHRKLISTLSGKNLDNLLKITNSRYLTRIKSLRFGEIIYVYYPNSLARAYIVGNARFIEDDDQILKRLAVNDPSSEVVIAGKGKDVKNVTIAASESTVNFTQYTGSRIEIKTESVKDGFLVLSDTYYPGWTAKIDGRTTQVMRANYDFRAIFLPKGSHTVVFEFYTNYLTLGMIISLLAIIIVIGAIFINHRQQLKSTCD
jgi:hypothetical protein